MEIKKLIEILSQYPEDTLINKIEIKENCICLQCVQPIKFIEIKIDFSNTPEN